MGLKQLLEEGIVKIAQLPPMNAISLAELDTLEGYTVPLIDHDYPAATPIMWNSVYKQKGLSLRNIMVIGHPKDTKHILQTLKQDPKYLGGGAGSGFKEKVMTCLDKKEPKTLRSVNIIVKEQEQLVGYNTDITGLLMNAEQGLEKVSKTLEGSTIVVLGAGGVAKELAHQLAQRNVHEIAIINRTRKKAVTLAQEINQIYERDIAYGVGEKLIRGVCLNTFAPPDIIINTSNKGSQGYEDISAFAHQGEANHTLSLTLLRHIRLQQPKTVFIDIVAAKERSISLRHADREGLQHTYDFMPMVVNQAVPAYKYVEKAHPQLHTTIVSEQDVLAIMQDAAERKAKYT
jgi:shikimate 5-dehydrogenase